MTAGYVIYSGVLVNVEQQPLQRGKKKSWFVGHADFCVVNASHTAYGKLPSDITWHGVGKRCGQWALGTWLKVALEPLYMSCELILKTSP